MERINIVPRNNWESKIQAQGFVYYKGYYNEDTAYKFTASEIGNIEVATREIFDMCLKVVQYVIDNDLWDEFFIPRKYADLIKWSWNEDLMSFYGRFDLAYNGSDIKLLEFNADTPTALFEASVIQWYWLQEYNSSKDQFNSIHEKLVDHMKVCNQYFQDGKLWFSCVNHSQEDFITVKYMQDVAQQAGIENNFTYIEDVGLNTGKQFVTKSGELIKNIFKQYPYEWMFYEEFGELLIATKDECFWIEPAYKSILSNKMLLKYLYQLFPNSPYILPCEFGKPITKNYVKKPVFSREGANITIVSNGTIADETKGEYGEEGFFVSGVF